MSISLALGSVLSSSCIGQKLSIRRGNFRGGCGSVFGIRSGLRLSRSVGFCVRYLEEVERKRIKSRISVSGGGSSGFNCFSPMKISRDSDKNRGSNRGQRIICSASALDYETLQWISSISCLVLMLARGTAINRSFLAPLFALQAPSSITSWIRGDYGISASFIALLVRLFFHIPGELELPFLTALLVIVTPYQASNLRGSKIGAVISLVIAGYLAFQHFSRVGEFRKAFDQTSIVATLAVVCITAVPCLLLF